MDSRGIKFFVVEGHALIHLFQSALQFDELQGLEFIARDIESAGEMGCAQDVTPRDLW
jgi:hypothetical protein